MAWLGVLKAAKDNLFLNKGERRNRGTSPSSTSARGRRSGREDLGGAEGGRAAAAEEGRGGQPSHRGRDAGHRKPHPGGGSRSRHRGRAAEPDRSRVRHRPPGQHLPRPLHQVHRGVAAKPGKDSGAADHRRKDFGRTN